MASSRLIAAGEDYTPDDINLLRADVLNPTSGHQHNGVDGARVPFANLNVTGAAGSTPPPGGSRSYNDLANHVVSSQGQHGLSVLAHVIGAAAPGLLVQTGVIPCAMGPAPNPGSDRRSGYVTFASTGMAFSGTPLVFCQENSERGLTSVGVYNVSATGFNWDAMISSLAIMSSIHWLAIGLKT